MTTRREHLWAGLRVCGLVLLVTLVVRRIEVAAVVASYRGVAPWAVGLAVLAVVVAMRVRLWKWHVQLRAQNLTGVHIDRGFLLGILWGSVTPLRLGELYRVAAIDRSGEGQLRAGAAVVLDKGYELWVVLATLAVGATLVGVEALVQVVVWASFLGLGWLLLAPGRGPSTVPREGASRVWRLVVARWHDLAVAKHSLGGRGRVKLVAATMVAHSLNLAVGWLIYRAFGALTIDAYLVRIPLVTLVNTVPITVGGFGARELAAMELFASVGYPAGAAAVAAAGLFVAANIVPALLLLPWTYLPGRAR